MSISPEDSDKTVNTGGGDYIGGNVYTQGGDFVGRDQYLNPTFYITTDQLTSLSAQPPAPPLLFVGRQEELRQLDQWLEEVTPEFMRNEGHPAGKMALIYGAEGIGKSSLMRRWLADLSTRPQPPIIAHITFDLHALVGKAYEAADWVPPIYKLDWQRLTARLPNQTTQEKLPADFVPASFRLGSCPWITLAAQLALQSQPVRDALNKDLEWRNELRHDSILPPDALTELLKVALEENRPLILACEGLQHASKEWFTLLKKWESESRRQKWPLFLILEYRYPQPLSVPALEATADERLQWLRESCGAPYFRAGAIQLAPLTRYDIEAMLLPASQQYATDLHILSDGNPKILSELFAYWRRHEVAKEELPGYWQLRWLPTDTYLFMGSEQNDELLFNSITRSLQHSSELAAELGYDLSADELLEWLNYAAWEGNTFSDQALAVAVGWHGELLNEFLTVLHEALCANEQHPTGLLEELDERIALPYGDNQTRYLDRYRFTPTPVAVLLRQRQSTQDRLRFGQEYAQALLAAYAPHHTQILEPLANLYQSLGLVRIAADYRERLAMIVYLNQEEAALHSLLAEATTASSKRLFVKRLLRFIHDAYDRRHPGSLLPWLAESLKFTYELNDKGWEGATLYSIGFVYSALGEWQQALNYYNKALPMQRQAGDKGGEANTLYSIGDAHLDLGDHMQALDYYNQALPLMRHVDNKGGEANTLTNIGSVYSALGKKQHALDYYNQALSMQRKVGDKISESTTLHNIGLIYSDLGEKQQALDYYNQALPLKRQVGDKVGEATTLHNIGSIYSVIGEAQKGLNSLNQALPLLRQVGDKGGEAKTLTVIGRVYFDLGEQQQALGYLNQALPLLRQVGNKGWEANILTDIGNCYANRGEKQQALVYYNQALPLLRQVGDKGGEANALTGIGHGYFDLGNKQQALDYHKQALPLRRQVGDKGGEANTLYYIGACSFALGAKEQALRSLNQALSLYRQIGDRRGERLVCIGFVYIFERLDEMSSAIEQQEQVVALAETIYHPDLEKDRAKLARLCQKLQQSDQSPNASPTSPTA